MVSPRAILASNSASIAVRPPIRLLGKHLELGINIPRRPRIFGAESHVIRQGSALVTQPPFYSSVLDAGTVHTAVVDGVATVRLPIPRATRCRGHSSPGWPRRSRSWARILRRG